MEQSSVHDANTHTVYSDVGAEEDIPAVVHNSKSTLAHGVARVLQVALKQVDLASVHDRIFRAESVERDFFFCDFDLDAGSGVRHRSRDFKCSCVLDSLLVLAHEP